MLTKDQKYYGLPEHEVILRSIAKKQRWIDANLNKPEGLNKRSVSITLLYKRLAELSKVEA
jgi:hypothetical protein